MSELNETLKLFGFLNIDDVTTDSLKKSFKTHILKAHPDKGGNAEEFDKMLHSYIYLTETVQRVSGGRVNLENIMSPDELKGLRSDEIIDRFFEEFYNEEFNKHFEETHKNDKIRSYVDWLKNTDEDTNLTNGIYGNATQKAPTFAVENLHTVFEETVKKNKSPPTAIILHPEAMAHVSGQSTGTLIIVNEDEPYTSDLYSNIEYTDVYSAFTRDNTICDKLTPFVESNITLDSLINERSIHIEPLANSDLEFISDFEKKKLEDNLQHQMKLKDYFINYAPPVNTVIENSMTEEEKSFILNF